MTNPSKLTIEEAFKTQAKKATIVRYDDGSTSGLARVREPLRSILRNSLCSRPTDEQRNSTTEKAIVFKEKTNVTTMARSSTSSTERITSASSGFETAEAAAHENLPPPPRSATIEGRTMASATRAVDRDNAPPAQRPVDDAQMMTRPLISLDWRTINGHMPGNVPRAMSSSSEQRSAQFGTFNTETVVSKAKVIKEKDTTNPTHETRFKMLQTAYEMTPYKAFSDCLKYFIDNYQRFSYVIEDLTGLRRLMSSSSFEAFPNAPQHLIDAVWDALNGRYYGLKYGDPGHAPAHKKVRIFRESHTRQEYESILQEVWKNATILAVRRVEQIRDMVEKLRKFRDVPKEKSAFAEFCHIYLRQEEQMVIDVAFSIANHEYKEALKQLRQILDEEISSNQTTPVGNLFDFGTSTNPSLSASPTNSVNKRKRSLPMKDDREEGEILDMDESVPSIHLGITSDEEDESNAPQANVENVQNPLAGQVNKAHKHVENLLDTSNDNMTAPLNPC